MKLNLGIFAILALLISGSSCKLFPTYPIEAKNWLFHGTTGDEHCLFGNACTWMNIVSAVGLTANETGQDTLSDGDIISGISFRSDESILVDSPATDLYFSNYDITFSNRAVTNSNLQTGSVFSNMHGSNKRKVHEGPLTLPAGFFSATPSGYSVNSFSSYIMFQMPFVYDASQGDVLFMEFSHTDNVQGNDEIVIDAAYYPNAAIYRRMLALAYNTGTLQRTRSHLISLIFDLQILDSPTWTCDEPTNTLWCYDAIPKCDSRWNGQPFVFNRPVEFSDAVTTCLNLGRQFECARCQNSRWNPCHSLVTGNSKGSGDPHFVGFDGSRFDFFGEDGKVFNIFSDVDFQLNSLFREMTINGEDGTWMIEMGIRSKNLTGVFRPGVGFLIDDQFLLGVNERQVIGDVIFETTSKYAKATTPGYVVKIDVVEDKVATANTYLNVELTLRRMPQDPHGIVGQTARHLVKNLDGKNLNGQRRTVEGEEMDYVVRDGILGVDFPFNRFIYNEDFRKPSSLIHSRGANDVLFEVVTITLAK